MWYEALPSLILTGAFVALPYAAVPLLHMLANNGNPYRRLQNLNTERWIYRRDERLGGGNMYKCKGLESIPD